METRCFSFTAEKGDGIKVRIQTLLGWLGIAVFFTACGTEKTMQTEVAVIYEEDQKNVLPAGIAELPVILTSAGQSIDLYVVQTLLKKGEVECEIKELLTAEELKNYKTLVLALGGSAKGLAAAGVTLEEELERIRSLISEAEKQEMTIITLHIGGSSRRGKVSDQFLPDALMAADAAVIVSEGDFDGKIDEILTEYGVPACYVENQIDAVEPLKVLFGKNAE